MSNGRSGQPIDILLVEDNPADIRLTMELLRDSKVRNNLAVVMDGEQALAYLRGEGEHEGAPRPDLIFLDLNLPRKDGLETLAEIKADPQLRHIPVVVLTTSEAEEDIVRTYDLQASCYVSKPVGLEEFAQVVKSIEDFWLTVVKLPPAE